MGACKKELKKGFKVKKNESKNKIGNQVGKLLSASLSQPQVSSNWVNFLKSNGMDKKLKKFLEKPQQYLPKKPLSPEITKVLSLDCEMVADLNNADMLARVSIVNYNLQCIYDKFVKPTANIGDYRTRVSGIRKESLEGAPDFEVVKEEVGNLLKNKILVGHALHNDLKALKIKHQNIFIRDTSTFPPFRNMSESKSPSLKKLAKYFLNESIQEGEHCSIEDAKTAMKLYKKFNKEWELSVKKSLSNKYKQIPIVK